MASTPSTCRPVSGASSLPRVPAIGVLCFTGRPSAVSRLVVPVSVDAVNSRVFRTRPHIRKKVLEAAPSFANGDTSATVVGVGGISRVINTPQHGHPRAPSAVIGAFDHGSDRPRRSLQRSLCLDFGSRFLCMPLVLHRVSDAGVVATHILADAVASLVNCRKLSTSAGAGLGLQRIEAASRLAPLRLGNLSFGFCGVMSAVRCHMDSVPTEGDEYNG